jgi:hypothetical protein
MPSYYSSQLLKQASQRMHLYPTPSEDLFLWEIDKTCFKAATELHAERIISHAVLEPFG